MQFRLYQNLKGGKAPNPNSNKAHVNVLFEASEKNTLKELRLMH